MMIRLHSGVAWTGVCPFTSSTLRQETLLDIAEVLSWT
jgi:hypothetical protein